MVNAYSTLGLSLEMDFVLLWLTGKLIGYRPRILRLLLAAGAGLVPTLWVLWRQNLYATPWEVELAWPVVMMAIAYTLPRRLWLKTYLLFWGLTVAAGGLVFFGLTWVPYTAPWLPSPDWVMTVPFLLLMIGAWVSPRAVRQYLGQEMIGEVTVAVAGKSLTVPVLWDSGNRLKDPVLRRPVVVVETEAALEWIPAEVLAWISRVSLDGVAPVPEAWQGRLGVVRFHSLGGQGVMPVLAVDSARGQYLGRHYPMVPVVVGFSRSPVSHDRSYRALAAPSALLSPGQEGVGA